MICLPVFALSGQISDIPKQATIIRHAVGCSDDDRRYDYALKLLRLILDWTVDAYGPYQMTPTLIEDGSFDRFFNKEYRKVIEQAKIPSRRRIDFHNPFLPLDTPLDIKAYWLAFE